MAKRSDIKKFQSMSNAEKRVAICRDVIKQLDLGVYVAGSTYFNPLQEVENEQEMITHESIRGKKCELCAKGALLVSRFGKFDKLGEFTDYEIMRAAENLGETLKEFPEKMANSIEYAFERNIACIDEVETYLHELDYEQADMLEISWNRSTGSEDRLRLICANIIRNKGEFKPVELFDYEIVSV